MEPTTAHLPLLVEMDEDGVYIISCPFWKGCHSYGKTMPEALANIREVIELCMEETPLTQLNQFIGWRELEVTCA